MQQPLDEVKALKTFLGALFGKVTNKTVQIGDVSLSQMEKQAREIVKKVLASFNIKTGSVRRKRSADTLFLRYHVSIGSKKFLLKCFVMSETRFFNLSLWAPDESKLLDILAVGPITSKYRLRAQAKIRLNPWAKGKK